MSAFHIALRGGYPKIANHFFETYPPKDDDHAAIYTSPDSRSNIHLALDAKEPEMVWMVLDKHLYTKEEMDQAWEVVNSKAFKSTISPTSKYDEFVNLFKTFGDYTAAEPESPPNGKFQQSRRPRPSVTVEDARSHTASPVSAASENPQTPLSASSVPNGSRPFRGQHHRRGSYRPHQHQQPSSPVIQQGSPQPGDSSQDGQHQSANYRGRGRGRGRGQYRGRGRGRGRGEAPVAA